MDDFLCFGLVENWKANDIFNTLADKIVKHVWLKRNSDLLVERVLGALVSPREVLGMHT